MSGEWAVRYLGVAGRELRVRRIPPPAPRRCRRRGTARRCRGAAAALQRVQQRRQHARAARADRVAERDGAAVDVHPCRIDAELVDHRDRLHRERFVDLEEVDVGQLPADLFARPCAPLPPASSAPASAPARSSPAPTMRASGVRPSARARSAAMTTSAAAPSLTPGALPAVTRAVLLERRLQRAERLGRGVFAHRFVAIDDDRVALLLRDA